LAIPGDNPQTGRYLVFGPFLCIYSPKCLYMITLSSPTPIFIFFSNYKITNSILNSLLFYPMQTYINSSVYIWSFYWSCVDVWRIYFIKLTSLLACFLYEELWSRVFIHISTFPLFQLVKISVFLSFLICDL